MEKLHFVKSLDLVVLAKYTKECGMALQLL